jgi:hypothetical protein
MNAGEESEGRKKKPQTQPRPYKHLISKWGVVTVTISFLYTHYSRPH